MPQYIVLKTQANGVPPDGQVGQADMYIGTAIDLPTAMAAAAAKWGLGPAIPLWGVLTSSLALYHTNVGVTAG